MKKLAAAIIAVMLMTACVFAETADDGSLPAFDASGYDLYTAAICAWLIDNEAGYYAGGDVVIPLPVIIETDDSDREDILVWGIYGVECYDLRNTTLFFVSGGSSPGLMHLRETEGGYVVTEFEAVGDGTDYDEGVQRIFGMREGLMDKLPDGFAERETTRLQFASDYVNANCLNITQLQDFGWLPVPLINAPDTAEEDQKVHHVSSLGYSVDYDLRLFSYIRFDDETEGFCGVDILEGISVNVQRYAITADEAIADLKGNMTAPATAEVTIGAAGTAAILLRDESLGEDVNRDIYVISLPEGCLAVSVSNTYYAFTDGGPVPGADEAIEMLLDTFSVITE